MSYNHDLMQLKLEITKLIHKKMKIINLNMKIETKDKRSVNL